MFQIRIFENNKTISNDAKQFRVELTEATGKGLIASAPRNTISVSIAKPQGNIFSLTVILMAF